MIITKLQGGLANQLFQWAYGESLSLKYNTPLYIDNSFYMGHQFGNVKRDFSLSKFPNLDYTIMPNERNISLWSNEKEKVRITNLTDDFNFKELNYDETSHYYLNGYWQSEKYFVEFGDRIKEKLKPNIDINIENESISLHIRRTDYVTSNGYHPVQSIDFYKNAIDIIGDYNKLYIFSDDIKWCKENLRFDNMVFVEGNEDVVDLWSMSLCDNNVIANSSFSWWGAWLNNNKDKKVIAPSNWFGEKANLNESDIIPENWIKI